MNDFRHFKGWFLFGVLFSIGFVCADESKAQFTRSDYVLKEKFKTDKSEIQGYESNQAPKTDQPSYHQFHFDVRLQNQDRWSYAYRVDYIPFQRKGTQLMVFLRDPTAVDGKTLSTRVTAKYYPTEKIGFKEAQALIIRAEKDAKDWDHHKQFLELAFSKNPKTAYKGWIKISEDLEKAHQKHPEHLGILKDLIVAYTQLNAFEDQTARGANLCQLIPWRIEEYKLLVDTLTPYEQKEFHKALALHYFQLKLYPLALLELENLTHDSGAILLKKGMSALGQGSFSKKEVFEVTNQQTTYSVTVYESTVKNSPDKKLSFHHWYFVPRLKSGGYSQLKVWYILSSQALTSKSRYYLYGYHLNQNKLLRLFGAEVPTYEKVKKIIYDHIDNALKSD